MFKFISKTYSATNADECWFLKQSFCSYSNLPVYYPESYISRHPRANYRIHMARLGDRILLVKSSGYVRSFEMNEEIAFTGNYISRHFQTKSGIILIEDYTHVGGADSKARKQYIEFHQNLHYSGRFIGSILYNMSTLFKISFKIAQRLKIRKENAFAADTYEQAIEIADKIIQRQNDNPHRRNIQEAPIEDSEIRNFSDRALTGSDSPDNQPAIDFRHFSLNRSSQQTTKVIEYFAQALLQYIYSIDWHKDGFEPFDSSVFDNQTVRTVFDAISFIKSEIDDLMHEREENEKALRVSEKNYRRIVEHANAGILEFDFASRHIISVNEYFQYITGYSKKALLAMDVMNLLADDSRINFERHLNQIEAGEALSEKSAYQLLTREGDIKWALIQANVTYENMHAQKVTVVLSDITYLKQTEIKLIEYQTKLKKLSIQLSMSEENQRRELASMLHDTISQELFGVYLQISALEGALKRSKHLQKLQQIRAQQLEIIKNARTLTFDLSPPVLYEIGLGEALKSLANSVHLKHGLPVQIRIEGGLDDINDEIKIILFRNTKELLHNIVKYARAESAMIHIYYRKNRLCVEVSDNGIGFDLNHAFSETAPHNGFGLFDIKEKMNHLGGSVTIDSSADKGTSICMYVPANVDVQSADEMPG